MHRLFDNIKLFATIAIEYFEESLVILMTMFFNMEWIKRVLKLRQITHMFSDELFKKRIDYIINLPLFSLQVSRHLIVFMPCQLKLWTIFCNYIKCYHYWILQIYLNTKDIGPCYENVPECFVSSEHGLWLFAPC